MSTSAIDDMSQFRKFGGSALRSDMEHNTLIRPIVFAHRANNDATIDSICRSCFLVVGRAFKEGDLECLELRHVCQPVERRKSIRTAHRVFPYHD